MTYEDAIAVFESKFKHVVNATSTNSARDERGKEYVAIYPNSRNGSNGKPPSPTYFSTTDVASDEWLITALDMIPGGSITLYWRVMPYFIDGNSDGYCLFARASFSSEPPLQLKEEGHV